MLDNAAVQLKEATTRTFGGAQGCLSPRSHGAVEANRYRAQADAERIRAEASEDDGRARYLARA